ncbi:MAG: helix-turn-helix domain-containing protein [Acidimicrobiales bacterium]|nr:helix-turn-helix domain-containing protein [Acidimicrobiales bacterium]MDG1846462.1 helix-turn-helix domain-containing protein [Acidimicrobiales bacterium]
MPKSTSNSPRFMTVGEVADLMRVSSMTVYRLIKAGDIRAARVGKSYRIREEDVDQFIASRYNQTG